MMALYLIRAANGLTKIGRARSPKHRLCRMRSESPVVLELIHESLVEDAPGAEADLHAEFAAKRSHGEWFSLDDADIAGIRSRFPTSDVPRSAGIRHVLLGLWPHQAETIRAAARATGLPVTKFIKTHGLAAAAEIRNKSGH